MLTEGIRAVTVNDPDQPQNLEITTSTSAIDVSCSLDGHSASHVPISEIPITSTTTQQPPSRRTVPRGHRYSMGLDLPPITLAKLPKTNPEAGLPPSCSEAVPSSVRDASSTIARGRSRHAVQKTIRYAPTDELRALLPKRAFLGNKNDKSGIKRGQTLEESADEGQELESEEDRVRVTRAKTRSNIISKRAPVEASMIPNANLTTTFEQAMKERVQESVKAREIDSWTAEQREAQQERIRYFKEVDDFKLEVETA
ncbi:hypothetical protein BGZ94_005587 [Podila epigama]|nr:hypothetical protein BGZ94_005587 [Podila epigama]